jgi:hypothetical protein
VETNQRPELAARILAFQHGEFTVQVHRTRALSPADVN